MDAFEARSENTISDEVTPSRELEVRPLWYRRTATLLLIGLAVGAGITAVVLFLSREATPPIASAPSRKTLETYFSESEVTPTPVARGAPGAPAVTLSLPAGWTDAGEDTPVGAYGAAFYDASIDSDYPSSIVVLLSEISGSADPLLLLEYSTGELLSLPDYTAVMQPKRSTLGGFEAVQLGGFYRGPDGTERVIAQKTAVVPSGDRLFLLQLNVDGPKGEAAALQEATALIDDQVRIVP